MNFASDNAAPVAPEILDALARVNAGFAIGYGNDEATSRVERQFSELFEREVAVFLVATGTAANALALAHLSPPWGAVFCHAEAHIATDECGAPEFYGSGLKLVGLPGGGRKITVPALEEVLERAWGGPHHVTPAVLSLTQATEAGTIYQRDEIARLAATARTRGMLVHMDGARFANALERL
ncbi:MAG: low specificity L-threonine aldolase, partial [Bradyrhizobiaceae bacterium]|nr:low specificity L-threonine aldolase [Bradyrhizobiaceae bacterium]